MKWLHVLSVFIATIGLSLPIQAQEIIVQEAGQVHMESAGGWVAAGQGFYGKVQVKEIQGGPGLSPIQIVAAAVREGTVAFGIESPENILRAREREGIRLVALSVDFQSSAMRIISWNPIRSSKDVKGNFGIWIGTDAKAKCAVGKGWEKQFTLQNQGENLKPWLTGRWRLASAMTYHDLITVQREMKRLGKTFFTVDYRDLGIDWMDNVLFTTEDIVKRYPDIVRAVVAGRYRGFKWALENPRETFEILRKINGSLGFNREMDAVDPLRTLLLPPDTKKHGVGFVQPKKWEDIGKDMLKAGLLEKMPDVKRAYTHQFPSGVAPR